MLQIGSLVDGKYKILRVVGKGGMSVVYQAVNEKANKIWAIKEVRKDGTQNFEVVKQNLIAETDMLKRFNHPNLPSIIDVIDTEDSFLIVMDYIEGNSLSKAIETSGAQSQDDVIEWSKQLCDVLGYLHSQNPPIIYRDMKPANVMLKPDGNISLIDFGTAREFKSTSVEDTTCLGTQGYAAPEQYGGHGQTDARTDIYCLGATMYHLITGHNPSTPPYEMYPIRQWNPMLSSGLEEIITKCTQRNPNDRYQSCAELLYALENYQQFDIENKKVQNLKWKTFLASTIAFLVLLVATIGLKIGASAQMTQTYTGKLEEADKSAAGIVTTPASMNKDANGKWDGTWTYENGVEVYGIPVNSYIEAIQVNPANPEAYNKILDLYMKDGILSPEEYNQFNNKILSTTSNIKDASGRNIDTYSSLLSGDKEAFAQLAADLGDDLFFCYGGADDASGIGYAQNWYGRVIDNSADEALKSKVQDYIDLSNVFTARRGTDLKGDSSYDFKGAFESMQRLADSIDAQNNATHSLRFYRTISRMLVNYNDKFVGSISDQDYTKFLEKISEKLSAIKSTAVYKDSLEVMEPYMNDAESNVKQALENGLGKVGA